MRSLFQFAGQPLFCQPSLSCRLGRQDERPRHTGQSGWLKRNSLALFQQTEQPIEMLIFNSKAAGQKSTDFLAYRTGSPGYGKAVSFRLPESDILTIYSCNPWPARDDAGDSTGSAKKTKHYCQIDAGPRQSSGPVPTPRNTRLRAIFSIHPDSFSQPFLQAQAATE